MKSEMEAGVHAGVIWLKLAKKRLYICSRARVNHVGHSMEGLLDFRASGVKSWHLTCGLRFRDILSGLPCTLGAYFFFRLGLWPTGVWNKLTQNPLKHPLFGVSPHPPPSPPTLTPLSSTPCQTLHTNTCIGTSWRPCQPGCRGGRALNLTIINIRKFL